MTSTARRMAGFALVLAVGATITGASAAAAGDESLFDARWLSERVLVLTERSPWESNHVVIVTARGMVLVDPGHTPLMGRLIRQAAAAATGRDRFAYIIDTHEHWGHTWGNAAFPEALVLAQQRATAAMRADTANRERRLAAIRSQAETARGQLAEVTAAGDDPTAERLRLDHLERIASGLAEPGFEIRLPDVTFSDRLELDLGDVTLELRSLGRGHSPSDLVVLIPEDKILLLGCFFLEQGPLPGFGTQPVLEPDRWLAVFNEMLDEHDVEQVVLGQHSVWSRDRLAGMRDYIARLWRDVQALDAAEVDLATALTRSPVPPELDWLRSAGIDADALAAFHRREFTALWRQLKESAAAEIERAVDAGGATAAAASYAALTAPDDGRYFVDENELNALGYRLLGAGRVDDAIAVFEVNVTAFPESWNVYDSLGEALAVKGNAAQAIERYRRSLELNPANSNGQAALERLAAGG